MSTHLDRVLRVAGDVTARTGGVASLKKASVSHFVPDPRDPRHRDQKIDVSDLNHILSIDVERKRCVAEPGVTFRELVEATLAHGLAPRMVPELETITIGGAVAGCAVESMAHRWGGFHDNCVEYEVVTGTGDIVRCSREHDCELFEMMHGSYGTLGIITELTFELTLASPFVKMEYVAFSKWRDFHAAMRRATRDPEIDFVDAIVHAKDELVLCIGRFVGSAPETSSYRADEIYYLSTAKRREDHLTTLDYFFRYDTDCHWTASSLPFMRTRLGRRLLGRFMLGSTNLLEWSEALRPIFKLQNNPPVVTDLFIPDEAADAFYEWYEQAVAFYPLWIVPYRMERRYPWIRQDHAAAGMYLDFAIYGAPGELSKQLEELTLVAKGIKTLISRNHYDQTTFARIYDCERYARIKRRMDPNNLFRTVYEKMVRDQLGTRGYAALPSTAREAASPKLVAAKR